MMDFSEAFYSLIPFLELIALRYGFKFRLVSENVEIFSTEGCPLSSPDYSLKINSTLEMEIFEEDKTNKVSDGRVLLETLLPGLSRYADSITDISQGDGSEKTLKELTELLENQAVGIGFADPEENFEYINQAGLKIFGFEGKKEGGKLNINAFLDTQNLTTVKKQTELRKNGNQSSYEMEIVAADGQKKVIHIKAAPRFSETGEFLGTYGVYRDVSRTVEIERALRRSESIFRAMLKNIPDAIIIKDLEGRFVHVNPGAELLLGKKSSELRGLTDDDVYLSDHPLLGSCCLGETEVKTTDRTYQFEGQEVIFSTTIVPLVDDGETLGQCSISRDITSERHAQNILKRSHDEYLAVFQNLESMVYVVDFETYEILFMNRQGISIWGNRVGEKCYEVFHDQENPCVYCTNNRIKNENKVYSWEYLNRRNHRWYRCNARPVPWPDNRIVRCEVADDITESKLNESRLRRKLTGEKIISGISTMFSCKAESELKDSVTNSLEVTGKFLHCDTAFFYRLKSDGSYKLENEWFSGSSETMGKIPIQIEMDISGLRKDFYWLAEKDLHQNFKFFGNGHTLRGYALIPLIRQDKLQAVCGFASFSKNPKISPEDLDVVHSVSELIFNEIIRYELKTEKDKLTEQLLQSQKLEAIGSLAGGIAHDFNNILTVILGNMSLLEMDFSGDEDIRATITEVIHAAQTASTLVGQLLAFSRKQVLEKQEVDVNEVLMDLGSMFKRLLGELVMLDVYPGEGLWLVKADPSQLKQVLVNLAVNARDALDNHEGRIVISTENIFISDKETKEENGRFIRISFTDNGSGMDENIQGRLFEPFFTTKGKGKGTGLGLATSYGIITQHGGTINVKSKLGQGTTFEILLPAAISEEAPDSSEEEHRTVLIIEENFSTREKLYRIMISSGYNVIFSLSPAESIKVASRYGGVIHVVFTSYSYMTSREQTSLDSLRELYPGIKIIYLAESDFDVDTMTKLPILTREFTPSQVFEIIDKF
ncbi:PAS domain S-box protein [Myxococcota bacterium]|nr:PAS domain S-box protein [Myxococcota bacterium]MBU1379935.1 PAS domain S-box protein [Myxococcota bacterium]MBU1498573.1 PAS domain S-box protein [Myxococcota bacterium]